MNLNAAPGNTIGGVNAGEANVIMFNAADGVNIATGTNNPVRGNRIFANGNLGLDLGANGVLVNDDNHVDAGANQLQNYPLLTTAAGSSGSVQITGSLQSRGNTLYLIDFYANYACDPTTNGEGQQYLGTTSVTTRCHRHCQHQRFHFCHARRAFRDRDRDGPGRQHLGVLEVRGSVRHECRRHLHRVEHEQRRSRSLRQAILDANLSITSDDTITFNIPGAGVRVISPTNALPLITDPVTINGYTQPGSVTNSAVASFNGSPLIQLDGASAGAGVDGLRFTAGSSTVRGLIITRFTGDGLEFTTNGNSLVEGCLIGIDLTNTNRPNGAAGVHIVSTAGNRIGGPTTGARNVISGNSGIGVLIENLGASNNVVPGNFIGVDLTGALDRGNGNDGVQIDDALNNRVGGTTAAERNVVSGNGGEGITLFTAGASGNQVLGNFIGTDATGGLAVGNTFRGIYLTTSARSSVIGGAAAGAGNRIAFNGADGVFVSSGTNNAIRGNAIFANGTVSAELGIDLGTSGVTTNDPADLDAGANQLQNFPLLTSATVKASSVDISGTLQSALSTTFLIDFYVNPACDTAGNGEGQIYLGSSSVATDGSGSASFAVTLTQTLTNRFITATATDPFGNTSEFSPCLRAESTVPAATFTVLNTANSGAGSLRQAILENNSTARSAANTIRFNIPGAGAQTIVPTNALPLITEAVIIDGLTQPGTTANTLATGHDANLLIRLVGTNAGSGTDGLRFASTGNIVRGLVILSFNSDGIEFTSTSGVSRVEGCLIGLDLDSTDRGNTGNGIFLNGSAGNVIGGVTPAVRNVISGNGSRGIEMGGAGGTFAVLNSANGVLVSGVTGNTVGGTAAGAGNVISGNGAWGIYVNGSPSSTIAGNFIGTDGSGQSAASSCIPRR